MEIVLVLVAVGVAALVWLAVKPRAADPVQALLRAYFRARDGGLDVDAALARMIDEVFGKDPARREALQRAREQLSGDDAVAEEVAVKRLVGLALAEAEPGEQPQGDDGAPAAGGSQRRAAIDAQYQRLARRRGMSVSGRPARSPEGQPVVEQQCPECGENMGNKWRCPNCGHLVLP